MSTWTEHERAVVDAVPDGLFIGGAWRPAASGARFPVEDPALARELRTVADADAQDARAAAEAAGAAQEAWAATAPRERGEILRRAYELLLERRDDLALLMTLEMGKPLAEAKGEVGYAAEFFRWFAEEAVRIDGGYQTSPDGKDRFVVMRRPVGPVLLITPWNFPLAMGTRKIGPAVAAGCTMIVKPAEQTPLSLLALAGILREAGLPDGVLNVLTTSRPGEVVEPLLRGGIVRKLSFTGSTAVGRLLLEQSAEQVLRVSLELGGNAPFLVFEDADLDRAVEGALAAKMRNMGEACTAANRLYVHESVAGAFAECLAARMGALTVGRGTEPGVDVGPLIDADGRGKVDELVEDAVGRGAKTLVGGEHAPGDGYFYRPTVLTGVPADAAMLHQEVFGPVAPILTFTDEDEVVAAANDTPYGLVSYVFTQSLERAFRLGERLDTGMVGLNKGVVSNPAAPFGGVKQSGLGREGGTVGIDEFLETRYLAMPLS
ncbi:NAD-dependent succinate-semialdehyde dehydrogenase [Streptomyces luteolus]|uniref:NAD-dependent succinate-semialdehyde dehydrogenase n=1 Tax=Streptomyces luteolus TaxID=3043615 RepID=A0ABT6SXN1_9ACTN|nr:NAD-dependent succinate-semialdehyde dehydrogenase [Streptomyces sp. B-S-A12]MDI3419427.1 NAD-dependent succinate-semialdehyde dehydrogenase [Streptomyces sp. B-S-A12]